MRHALHNASVRYIRIHLYISQEVGWWVLKSDCVESTEISFQFDKAVSVLSSYDFTRATYTCTLYMYRTSHVPWKWYRFRNDSCRFAGSVSESWIHRLSHSYELVPHTHWQIRAPAPLSNGKNLDAPFNLVRTTIPRRQKQLLPLM